MTFYGADTRSPRHAKVPVGPWRGIETNIFDKTNSLEGALSIAENVIFERFKPGAGTPTPARVRPGRRLWTPSPLKSREYLTRAQSSESGWVLDAGGSFSTTQVLEGTESLKMSLPITVGVQRRMQYRVFPTPIDLTAGGAAVTLDNIMWRFGLHLPAFTPGLSISIALTCDPAPGAPGVNFAGWVNKVSPGGMSVVGPSLPNWGTWNVVKVNGTLGVVPDPDGGADIDYFSPTGLFANPATVQAALSNITAIAIQIASVNSPAVDVYFDDSYLNRIGFDHVVGLGSFTKADTQNQYLLAKVGSTLYVDENDAKAFKLVKTDMATNAPAYFAHQYNQMFVADGSEVLAFDAVKWPSGAYKVRPAGFPTPSIAGVVATGVAGGAQMTTGNHFVAISYIYGEGADVYGQSNVVPLPAAVTIAAGQKLRVSGLPVPDAASGVVKKRIYVSLAGASKYATTYFALELSNADTDTIAAGDIDISDADLTAPLNPAGPTDNDIPPICRYIIPYEGSMIYVRLSSNPAALSYSRRGSDLNSGPEVVPGTNIAVNQRGEGWTGGIVRNGALYLFTRRSIHIGKFSNLGILNVTQLDGSGSGSSESIGAVDQSAIWKDDENNILFKSEMGEYILDPSDRLIPLAKRSLKNEYQDVNDLEASNSFSYHTRTSQADWLNSSYGVNTDPYTTPGALSYKFPYNQTATLSPSFSGGGPFNAPRNSKYDTSLVNLPAGLLWIGSQLVLGDSWGVLMQTQAPVRIESVSCLMLKTFEAAPFAARSVQITCRIKRFKYQNGRVFSTGATSIGATVATQSNTQVFGDSSNPDMIGRTQKYFNFVFATPVYIPEGEWFYITYSLDSLGGAAGLHVLSADEGFAIPLHSAPGFSFNMNYGSRMNRFTAPFDPIEYGNTWGHMSIGYIAIPAYELLLATVGIPPKADLQRWGRIDITDTLGNPFDYTLMGAKGSMEAGLEYFDPGVPGWVGYQAMQRRDYAVPNITPANSASNFGQFSDYRPLATYPGAEHRHWTQARILVKHRLGGNYGYDIVNESESRVSTSLNTAFGQDFKVTVSWNEEASFAVEPYPQDIWQSTVIDTTAATSWGTLVMDALIEQQGITVQARTDSDLAMGNNYPWNDIIPGTAPTLTQLPINGQYLQLRIIFRDREGVVSGVSSEVRSLTISWQLSTQGAVRPVVPPAGCYFRDYHLVAYAPAGSRVNSAAWCLSPGFKFSKWTYQPVNCWIVHNKKLLAGMASTGQITEYWQEDYLDDGQFMIAATVKTQVLNLGSANIKTFSGFEVFTGIIEYMGASLGVGDAEPVVGSGIAGDCFYLTAETASGDRSLDTPAPYYTLAPLQAAPILTAVNYGVFVYQKYDAPTHNDPDARIPALAQTYFFDALMQDAYVQFTWRAYAHQLDQRVTPGTLPLPRVNRFPYLSLILPQFYIENISGIHSA